MQTNKDELLRHIRKQSMAEARYLAGEFVRAASEQREAILAALEIEQWLARSCEQCLGLRQRRQYQ